MSDSVLWLESPWLFSTLLSEHRYRILHDLDIGFGDFLIICQNHLEQGTDKSMPRRSHMYTMGWVSRDHRVLPAKATCVSVSVHVCMLYVCAGMHGHVCACACRDQGKAFGVLPQEPAALNFEARSLTGAWNSLIQWVWLPAIPRNPLVSTFPVMELQMGITRLGFYTWDQVLTISRKILYWLTHLLSPVLTLNNKTKPSIIRVGKSSINEGGS